MVPFISVELDFVTFHTHTQKKTGLDSVVLKVAYVKINVYGVNMTPNWNGWEMCKKKKN